MFHTIKKILKIFYYFSFKINFNKEERSCIIKNELKI